MKKWLLETFTSMHDMDCRAHVRSTVLVAKDQTVEVEHGHSSMRRYIYSKSEESKALDIDSLNCNWTTKKGFRARENGVWPAG